MLQLPAVIFRLCRPLHFQTVEVVEFHFPISQYKFEYVAGACLKLIFLVSTIKSSFRFLSYRCAFRTCSRRLLAPALDVGGPATDLVRTFIELQWDEKQSIVPSGIWIATSFCLPSRTAPDVGPRSTSHNRRFDLSSSFMPDSLSSSLLTSVSSVSTIFEQSIAELYAERVDNAGD
jgi:hypothetical protein